MTKDEYAEVRDLFLNTLREIRSAENCIVGDITEWDALEDDDVARALDERGHWIKAREYEAIQRVVLTLEALVGRAHERAT